MIIISPALYQTVFIQFTAEQFEFQGNYNKTQNENSVSVFVKLGITVLCTEMGY